MGKQNDDPIGQIGAVGGQQSPSSTQLSTEKQHRHLEGRLQQMRPADVTRASEKALEPTLTDHIDIPFEHDPDLVDGGGASDASAAGLGQPSLPFEGGAPDEEGPGAVESGEGEGGGATASSSSSFFDGAPASDASAAAPVGAAAPPTDMRAEMEQARRSLEPMLSGAPNSVLGGNAAGLITPNSGLPRGMAVDGARAFADRDVPADGFVATHAPGWGLMNAAMFGLTALSAFTPFMYSMPFMGDPMSMGLMGGLGMMGNMVPMLSMMSLNMMMMQNMAMTPPLMSCMPWACGTMPYPFPMMNPYTMPPGAPMPGYGTPGATGPGYGMPGQEMPGYGMPGYGTPGAAGQTRPGPVVSRIGTAGPPQSTLVEGGQPHALGEAGQARLAAMTPERREAFEALHKQYEGVEVTLPGRAEKVNVNEALGRLLESGKLDAKDKDGRDLLDNLTGLASQPVAPGLDGRLITAQTIMHTADPAATMTQGDRGTCAAATVEYMLARRNPAEYTRVVSGLTSPEGTVALVSGRPAMRVADSVPEDGSGRTAVNRVVQAAFMNAEGVTAGDGQYSNVSDTFQSASAPGWNPFGLFGKNQEQGGLRPLQVQNLATHVMGDGYVEVFQEGQNPYAALPIIDRATRMPDNDGVPVSMQWDGGRHRVLVTGVSDGRVYFRNPWGERTTANADDRLFGADHQIHEGGVESVSVNDFAARMKSAIVPQRFVS